jgi:DNA primase
MITLEGVNEFIYANLQNVKTSKNGTHFHARCPLCGDSKKSKAKKRFHLDYNEGQPFWHCFNCGRSGSFLQLYAEINGTTVYEAKKHFRRFDVDYLTQALSPKKKEKVLKEIHYETHNYILDDCVNINDDAEGYVIKSHQKALQGFINRRNLPDNFPLYIAYKGDYKSRIIIPVFEGDDIVYFQGRACTDSIEPKFKNPTLKKGDVILNKDKFNRSKYIIITEGLIDAFIVGDQCTCALGASISEYFVDRLLKLTDKGVIVALDNDETGENEYIKLLEESFGHKLKYFEMPYKYQEIKDINMLVEKYDIENMYQFIVDNSYTSFELAVKLKMGGKM